MLRLRSLLFVTVSALLLIALAIAIFISRSRGFSARAEPSSLETSIATMARQLAMPSNYRGLHSPLPMSPENIQAGMQHFSDHCATCHANNGAGDTLFGKGLYPKPPDLRKPDTQNKSDGELYYVIENGIRLSGMPAFGEHPGPGDIETWHLVVFIRHLPSLTDAELAKMTTMNPKTEEDRKEEQEEQKFLQGDAPQAPSAGIHHQ